MSISTFDGAACDFVASAMADDLAAIRALLATNPELVHSRNDCHETPLHSLAIEDRCAAVELLIEAGADVEATGTWGRTTPLYDVAGLGLAEMARLLIGHGADANRPQAAFSERPLHAAARHAPNAEIVAVLLAAGADIEARVVMEYTPLHVATRANNVVAVRALLAHGASRAAMDEDGRTAAAQVWPDAPAELVGLLRPA
jgi:ankyrin repeat protein